MRHFLPSLLLIVAGSVPSFASIDSGLLALVPSSAKVIAGVDVSKARNSQLGQFMLSQTGTDQHFQQLQQQTGFDPRQDLESFLLVTPGPNAGSSQSGFALLARGIFNPDRIQAAAVAKGATLQSFEGFNLIVEKSRGSHPQNAFAFLAPDVAVMADLATLQQIVANHGSSAGSAPAIDPGLLSQIEAVGSTNDAWFVSLVPGSTFGKNIDPQMQQSFQGQIQALQSILQSSGGVRFGDMVDVTFDAITRSAQDAVSMTDVVRFLTSMVQMQRDKNAGAAILAPAFDNMNLSTNGSAVHITVSLPEQGVEQLAALQPMHQTHVHDTHRSSNQ